MDSLDWDDTPWPCAETTVCELLTDSQGTLQPLDEEAWSFSRLRATAQRLARRLRLPVAGERRCVALGYDEGLALVLAQLAVVEAGLHFLPLDLRQPVERLEAMLEMAGAILLLAPKGVPELRVRQMQLEEVELLEEAEVQPPRPEDLCYVQFTSGSTGRPKGVLCEHRHCAWYAAAKAAAEGIDGSSRLLLTAAFTFDPCQGDIFCALAAGATLVVAPRLRLLHDFREVLEQSEATHVCATPALWQLLDAEPEQFPRLRCLSLGGEKMPPKLVERWAPNVELRNVYGVTEATVYQTVMPMLASTPPHTAGRPLPGVRVCLRPWPGEDAAEVVLGGPGVARGYLGAGPFGGRFATGDCGRWARAGEVRVLEVLGRRDLQVKLNGERIELGEVEQLLGTCPLVAQCVAVPWGGALLAHVVLDGEEMDGLVALALAAHCDRHLPRIMRPRLFVAADALPLTANGKVNRAALPTVPPPGPSARASHEPLTELEEAVAIAWASELSLPDGLGADSDFYSLGGGSVQAVRVTRVLRAVLHGGGGGKPRWAEGASDWRDPAGDAALFLPPERAGDAECHFGLCDGGPFAPCALLERPVLRHYAQFLVGCGVRVAETAETAKATRENAEHAGAPEIELSPLPRALETAIRAGRETLARALLWAGCSLSQSGPGPLHWAASRCSDSLVRLLVRHRANVLHCTDAGAVAAHGAAAAGNAKALAALLELGTPPRVRDRGRQSLLHYAARSGEVAAVQLAAEAKAEVNCRDRQLRTALHWAALHGDVDICRALLHHRADPSPPKVPASLHRRRTRLEQVSFWDVIIESLEIVDSQALQLFEQVLDAQTCERAQLQSREAADVAIVASAMKNLGRELQSLENLQPLVMTKALKQVEVDFYDTLLQQRELQQRQEASKCHGCALKHRHYEQLQEQRAVATDIEDLSRELGSESLGLLPQLRAKEQVLNDLGCLDEEGLISLKGRAATEVLSGDEVTIIEVVFHNVLDGCSAAEVAAAVSAFVFPDKVDEQEDLEELPANLSRVRAGILQQHRRVELLLRDRRVEMDAEELQRCCNVALMGIAYRWASGESLSEIMKDSQFQEGAIVRAIVRAEELLRKLQDVAKLLGNRGLHDVFSEAADLIHRDIAFVPSLYIKRT
ncbi:unnamed protein product [Effrenium voratum]|uniref:ATP-dependent RNA helicase Ski2/MTR4 C-terminal domain-containing protein n=1 Tax=Effrenium voratum TaxID=2562239 RepID=A0AA36N5Y0_9DINO|nr:unnamed protein product [Effrenium voratum]